MTNIDLASSPCSASVASNKLFSAEGMGSVMCNGRNSIDVNTLMTTKQLNGFSGNFAAENELICMGGLSTLDD